MRTLRDRARRRSWATTPGLVDQLRAAGDATDEPRLGAAARAGATGAQLDSPIADIKNMGGAERRDDHGRRCSSRSSSAARPWAHLDIAGTDADRRPTTAGAPRARPAFGARLLVELRDSTSAAAASADAAPTDPSEAPADDRDDGRTEHTALGRLLDFIERVGNKVPHPAMMFLYLIIGVIVLSAVLALRRRQRHRRDRRARRRRRSTRTTTTDAIAARSLDHEPDDAGPRLRRSRQETIAIQSLLVGRGHPLHLHLVRRRTSPASAWSRSPSSR